MAVFFWLWVKILLIYGNADAGEHPHLPTKSVLQNIAKDNPPRLRPAII